jgi:hypothetical protein
MRVYVDLISGDEFVSDSYPSQLIHDDACLEVKGRYVKKGSEQIAIASDDIIEEDENAVTVVDIVDAFQLNEIQLGKKDFAAWVKNYLGKITEKLKEQGKEDRIDNFKKGATALTKAILAQFDEFQIYTGPKYDMEGGLAFSYQKEQTDDGPTFLFYADGFKIVKF